MNTLYCFTLLLIVSSTIYAQDTTCTEYIDLGLVTNSNEDFDSFHLLKNTLKDVEIVMLGEQSHGEGTTYETKTKLIKFLHKEMGFDMLVFESGIYSCNTAWAAIQQGQDTKVALAKSVFFLWSITKQFEPLATYIDEQKDSKHPLIISGFDHQFTGTYPKEYFIADLKAYLSNKKPEIIASTNWKNLEQSIQFLLNGEYKKYKKQQALRDTVTINSILSQINSTDSIDQYWMQVLKSTKYFLSDTKLKTDYRDQQMAENLIWLKEQYPDKKIICWGATSHFLYNSSEVKMMKFPYNMIDNYYQKQRMMGDYIKEKYQSEVYTIGFVAYQGDYGLDRKRKIKPAKQSSLEHNMEQSGLENCFLDLTHCQTGTLISRPLANQYMKNPISNVMDCVVFNKLMKRYRLDRNFFLEMYPENKWVQPESTEEE
jgi:erythromycin esterase